LEIIMRRYERASTMLTSNRPVQDWGKLLGDAAAVSAMLDRLLHHGRVLKCGPRELAHQVGGRNDRRLRMLRTGAVAVQKTESARSRAEK
jgi:DNA replication protein DnaC